MRKESTKVLANVAYDIPNIFAVFLEILLEINALTNSCVSRLTRRKDGDRIHQIPKNLWKNCAATPGPNMTKAITA